jgi:hypothetical protein
MNAIWKAADYAKNGAQDKLVSYFAQHSGETDGI